MKIDKNSWHYKLYRATHIFRPVPSTTNLCKYMQRLVFGTIFILGIMLPIGFACWVLLSIVFHVVKLFIWKPTTWKLWRINPFNESRSKADPEGREERYILYPGWAPWQVLLATVIPPLAWWIGSHVTFTHGALMVLGVVLAIGVLVVALGFWSRTSSAKILRQYIRAKKQGVCPLVEFTYGEEQETE